MPREAMRVLLFILNIRELPSVVFYRCGNDVKDKRWRLKWEPAVVLTSSTRDSVRGAKELPGPFGPKCNIGLDQTSRCVVG